MEKNILGIGGNQILFALRNSEILVHINPLYWKLFYRHQERTGNKGVKICDYWSIHFQFLFLQVFIAYSHKRKPDMGSEEHSKQLQEKREQTRTFYIDRSNAPE